MTSIPVSLGDRSYDVLVELGARKSCGALLRELLGDSEGRRLLLVADEEVAETHAEDVAASMEQAGFGVALASVEALEVNKSLNALSALLEAAARERIDRSSAVVAVGGGVIGDLAGFVAATWLRGIPIMHVPTTLLAMVDASIGGKTGVNLPLPDGFLGKNLVGAIWQPIAVVSDPETLASLPRRERSCGLAECVKHAVISDWSFLDDLRAMAGAILGGDPTASAELVVRSASIKARVVSEDEREDVTNTSGSVRAFLNLGHTFAHAIETAPELDLKHGEAVAVGLMAAAACAQALGEWGDEETDELRASLQACELPVGLSVSLEATTLIERMSWDKKVRRGTLSIVVPSGRGSVRMVEGPEESLLRTGWEAVGAR
jgi:3-dehydroquinate synthase